MSKFCSVSFNSMYTVSDPNCQITIFTYSGILLLLTLARFLHFATLATGGRGRPPWRLETKRLRAQRKEPADCSRRVLAIGSAFFFILGQKLTPFWGSKVKFSGNWQFFKFALSYFKSIDRNDIRFSPAVPRSIFNNICRYSFWMEYM